MNNEPVIAPDFLQFKPHPIAAMIPVIGDREFVELKESIDKYGQFDEIVIDLDRKEIIDGLSRFRACKELGITPRWVDIKEVVSKFAGYHKYTTIISQYIIHKNIFRRHLSDDQRAQIVLKVFKEAAAAALQRQEESRFKSGVSPNPGGKRKAEVKPKSDSPQNHRDTAKMNANSTVGQIAADAKVSRYAVTQAKQLAEKAPELAEQVRAGSLTQKEAMKEARKQGLIKRPVPKPTSNGDYVLNLTEQEATKLFTDKVKTAWTNLLNLFAPEEQIEAIKEIKKLIKKQ